MKKIALFVLAFPGAALAHPGHAELPGPAGHDLAHLALGGGIAVLAVAGIALFNRRSAARRQEE